MRLITKTCFSLAALAALALAPLTARAQSDSGLAVGVGVGTDGISGQLSYMFSDSFGIRAKGSWFRISKGIDTSNVHYDGHFRPQTFDLLADLFPFDSAFRFSAGGVYNRNRVTLKATPLAATTIGNVTYTPAQLGQINGRIDFRSVSPYAGLGITTNRRGPGWQFIADAGVIFAGRPRVDLTATGLFANDPTFRSNLALEQQRVADKIDWARFYPVVKIGVAYHF